MHDEEVMIGLLHKLKGLGVELAMDDFGTGYSSLAQLRTMPIDVLKIDKMFVGGSASGEEEWAFSAAIIRLAHSLGKRVAEGIEHPSQLDHLLSLGCELGQGFLFGSPMSLQEFLALPAASPEGRSDSTAEIGSQTNTQVDGLSMSERIIASFAEIVNQNAQVDAQRSTVARAVFPAAETPGLQLPTVQVPTASYDRDQLSR
jgi:hypothetical protein